MLLTPLRRVISTTCPTTTPAQPSAQARSPRVCDAQSPTQPVGDRTGEPPATVVIPTHNRHEGLAELLDDLLQQDGLPAPVEVLVVDSPVAHSAAGVVEQAAARGLSVTYHLTDNSAAAKRSLGATLASGDVVLFADDDMRLPTGWVRGHLDVLERRRDVVSCGSVDFPPAWVAGSNYYRFKQDWHRPHPRTPDDLRLPPWRVVTMNMAASRELLVSSEGWDKEFVHYGAEDVEWGLRVARDYGALIVHSPEARAVHQEVRQDVVGFSRKLYLTAYHGHGLLLAKAEESRQIPTLRITEPGLAQTPGERLLVRAGLSLGMALVRESTRPRTACP